MNAKIVITEKGLKITNELFGMNSNDPPPFMEEGKPITKPGGVTKL